MSVSIDLAGRAVLVTGAAGGIGSACARRLAGAGASVALTDLQAGPLDELRERIGGDARAWPADLRGMRGCVDLVDEVMAAFGRVDALVACAGIMQTAPLLDLTEDDWRGMLEVNLTGTFLMLQAVAPRMRESGGGSIVVMASVAGRSGRDLAAHYAASKAGLLSLTKSAALALAPSIRVNAICPGVVMTSMWDGIIRERDRLFGPGSGAEHRRRSEQAAPLKRTGESREIADVALFLVSDLASYVTGQALNVDGGLEMD